MLISIHDQLAHSIATIATAVAIAIATLGRLGYINTWFMNNEY